tara:strand:+ start:1109 stop:1318 length:210 start_codon:yes stop_codon:yes gene_type:complete
MDTRKKTKIMIITTKQQLEKMYNRLLENCDKAIDRSTDDWALEFWKKTKNKLYINMSKHGILKNHKTIH